MYEVEDEFGDMMENYIIDECSLLRHEIVSDSYFLTHKSIKFEQNPEERILFSRMPPPQEMDSNPKHPESVTELELVLNAHKPGLRDDNWVSQVKRAFKNSDDMIQVKNSFYCLLPVKPKT